VNKGVAGVETMYPEKATYSIIGRPLMAAATRLLSPTREFETLKVDLSTKLFIRGGAVLVVNSESNQSRTFACAGTLGAGGGVGPPVEAGYLT
jgi:hypothetical protein